MISLSPGFIDERIFIRSKPHLLKFITFQESFLASGYLVKI